MEEDEVIGPSSLLNSEAEVINVKKESKSGGLKQKNILRIGELPYQDIYPPFDQDVF